MKLTINNPKQWDVTFLGRRKMKSTEVKGNDVLIDNYLRVRQQTQKLCSPLLAEDYVVQPITDVSPPKWHLGHTTWFFEAFVLSRFNSSYKPFDPAFNYIFNSYYESIGDRVLRTHRGNLTRPGVEEIYRYREYVDRHIKLLLENYENSAMNYLLELGLQHEQQHQELLLTDIKYILGHNPLFPVYLDNKIKLENTGAKSLGFIEIPEGIYEIGYKGTDFSFDNEKPVHKAYVNGFRIADRLITNKEYWDFMIDGGYRNFRFWLAEGWDLIKTQNWEAPFYWMQKNGDWYEYTLAGLAKVNPNLPVTHISFYEADAYANWAGKRLLGEAEWEVAACLIGNKSQKSNFMDSGYYHPTAATEDNYQLFGDAWEWTYSAYHPYPGYHKAEGALGEYNGKFMINQIILRGGSCATPKDHIRYSYRNFFHPDKRWQFTGIKLADKV